MSITEVQFSRGCAWCDRPLSAEDEQFLVSIRRDDESLRTFHAHADCFVASLSPRSREIWENTSR